MSDVHVLVFSKRYIMCLGLTYVTYNVIYINTTILYTEKQDKNMLEKRKMKNKMLSVIIDVNIDKEVTDSFLTIQLTNSSFISIFIFNNRIIYHFGMIKTNAFVIIELLDFALYIVILYDTYIVDMLYIYTGFIGWYTIEHDIK